MCADKPSTALFSDRVRSDSTFSGPGESTWAFLDRVTDPAVARIRALLERWFAEYPEAERADLRGRLTSGDHWQFHSAWFELYLYAFRIGARTRPRLRTGALGPGWMSEGDEGVARCGCFPRDILALGPNKPPSLLTIGQLPRAKT
jgi:hypothetical protein